MHPKIKVPQISRSISHSYPVLDNEGRESLDNSVKENSATTIPYHFIQIPLFPSSSSLIQSKLRINTPGDRYEQEADRIAEQVMRLSGPPPAPLLARGKYRPKIQRQCLDCEEEQEREEDGVDHGLSAEEEQSTGLARNPPPPQAVPYIPQVPSPANIPVPPQSPQRPSFRPSLPFPPFPSTKPSVEGKPKDLLNGLISHPWFKAEVERKKPEFEVGKATEILIMASVLTGLLAHKGSIDNNVLKDLNGVKFGIYFPLGVYLGVQVIYNEKSKKPDQSNPRAPLDNLQKWWPGRQGSGSPSLQGQGGLGVLIFKLGPKPKPKPRK